MWQYQLNIAGVSAAASQPMKSRRSHGVIDVMMMVTSLMTSYRPMLVLSSPSTSVFGMHCLKAR